MADLVTTRAILQNEFADNATGNITAQFGRNLVVSAFGYVATGPPSVGNDNVDTAGIGAKFDTGSMWFDTTNKQVWGCISGSPGAAVWVVMSVRGTTGGPFRLATLLLPSATTDILEDTILSYTVPPNRMLNAGDTLDWFAAGRYVSSAAAKRIRVYFGATTLFDTTINTAGIIAWQCQGRLSRVTGTTQISSTMLVSEPSTVQQAVIQSASPAETLSGNVVWKITGQTVAGAGSLLWDVATLDFWPAS